MSELSASQEVLDSAEYDTLTKYLAGDIKDLAAALAAFAKPVEDKYMSTGDASDVQGLLSLSWDSVVAIAASTAYTSPRRQKLADFLVRLAYRPTLMRDGEVCQISGMTVWRDLPTLGWEIRDAWNFGTPLC